MTTEQAIQDVAMIARNGIDRLGDGRPACGTSSAKRDIDRRVMRHF